ncbi:MAG: NitT/TauT family transport system ATP-binding protein [Methylobacteriaceae bacterium]|jgi:NitT/TauT family transport system ATP-binding protein|nr:NitT/TauT family transport system ATP-binding protein [Methylobacteriaceae bacterium]
MSHGVSAGAVADWRNIIDNVLLPAEIVGLPMKAARERAGDLLRMVGLGGFETKYPRELSGGMQQRAAIARAFIHDPKTHPHGRAVRCARCADARTDEFGDAAHLAAKRQDDHLRHPRHSGSGFSRLTLRDITARPARMARFLQVGLPYPRDLKMKTTSIFGTYVRQIYDQLGITSGGERDGPTLI